MVPGRRAHRAPHPGLHPVERHGHGHPGQPPLRRPRRPPVDLRLVGLALRGRASTTSSTASPTAATATRSSSRATPPPASTPGPTSRAASPRTSSTASAGRSAAAGCPSYPHPRRMPDFWEFPTVSMGLGPLNAVYQARFNRYLLHRQIADTSKAKVWCFVGDGEMDEPESMAALHLAATEQLDNLIFVVNCNLQRLDGPVRGNGKIIQEFEATYRGGGWNVIKVVWGREWDDLLQRDVDGVLVNQMNTTCDGPVPEVLGGVGRLHPGALLRPRPPAAQAGRAPLRRRPPQAAPGRARLPQGLRRLQGRHRARGQPDRHPGPHHQGLDARPRVRGPQRHPPDQEDDRGGAEDVPRPALPRHPRQGPRRGRPALLPPRPEVGGARVHAVPAPGPRRARTPSGWSARRRCRPLAGDPFKDLLSGTGEKVKASTTSAPSPACCAT